MRTYRSTIKLSILAAGIAASTLAVAGNDGLAARSFSIEPTLDRPIAQSNRNPVTTPVVKGDRKLVVSLTSTMGDVGSEIFDGQTKRYTSSLLPKSATDVMVHLDVDSLDMKSPRTQAVLRRAKDMNWVVIAESGNWDVPRLHEFVAAYAPGTNGKSLQNVAVRIAWNNKRALVTDLTPAEAAVEVGIDYLDTSEAKALARNEFSTKTIAPGSYYAWFANNAYQATASNRWVGSRYYKVALNRDVVKVWRSTYNGVTRCIVSWRGSSTAGDWLNNFTNQFGGNWLVPGESLTNFARIGKGYAYRLANYRGTVNSVPCSNRYIVTGHSLGGAMAEAYAYTRRSVGPSVEAYNPARVGNYTFRVSYRNALSSSTKVFCRTGDPVWAVPTGLHHVGGNNGCTYWGARNSWWNLISNHSMSHWL